MSIKTQYQKANDALKAMLSDDTVLSTRISKNPYIAEFYRDYGWKAGSWNRLMSPNKGDNFFFYSLDRKYEVPFEEQTITVYEVREENGFLYSNINGEECIIIPCEESWTSWRGNARTHRYCQVVTLEGKQLDCIWLSLNYGGPEDVWVKQPYSIMDVIYFLFSKEIDNWMNCKKFRFEYYSSRNGKTTDFTTQSIQVKLNIHELILNYISTKVYNVLCKYYIGCKFYIHGGVSPKTLIESEEQGTTRKLVESLISRKKSRTSDRRLYHRLRLEVIKCVRKGTYVNEEDLIKYNLINPVHHNEQTKIFVYKYGDGKVCTSVQHPSPYITSRTFLESVCINSNVLECFQDIQGDNLLEVLKKVDYLKGAFDYLLSREFIILYPKEMNCIKESNNWCDEFYTALDFLVRKEAVLFVNERFYVIYISKFLNAMQGRLKPYLSGALRGIADVW